MLPAAELTSGGRIKMRGTPLRMQPKVPWEPVIKEAKRQFLPTS